MAPYTGKEMDLRKDDEDSSVSHEPDFFDRVFADIDRFSLRLWNRCGLKIVLVPLIYFLYVYVIGGVVFSLIERPTGCGFFGMAQTFETDKRYID